MDNSFCNQITHRYFCGKFAFWYFRKIYHTIKNVCYIYDSLFYIVQNIFIIIFSEFGTVFYTQTTFIICFHSIVSLSFLSSSWTTASMLCCVIICGTSFFLFRDLVVFFVLQRRDSLCYKDGRPTFFWGEYRLIILIVVHHTCTCFWFWELVVVVSLLLVFFCIILTGLFFVFVLFWVAAVVSSERVDSIWE